MNSHLKPSQNNDKNENFICDFKNVCLKENVHLKRDKNS